MRVVFAGSPAFVVPVLHSLVQDGHEVVSVLTAPERPAGRGHVPSASPVQEAAERLGLDVLRPEDVNGPEVLEALRARAPDAIVVAAYGRMFGRALLALPPLGCLNVHLSLLPKYRGAAPVARAIQRGETVTGVSIIRMTPRLDAGPVLLQRVLEIGPDETAGELRERLGRLAAQVLPEALDRVRTGRAVFRPQDEAAATLAPALEKDEGIVNWARPAAEIRDLVRAMNPWPMAFTFRAKGDGSRERLLLCDVARCDGPAEGATGGIVALGPEGPVVRAGEGCLVLRRVKPAGGREMDGAAYARGHRLAPGERFEGGSAA